MTQLKRYANFARNLHCDVKIDRPSGMDVHVLRTEKAESEAQRGKPKCTLESEIRRCGFVVRTAPSALYWCVKVVIDCQAINDVYETTARRGECGDDDVYYYIRWRLKLEGETENMGVCTKERKGVAAAVLMATPCTNSLGREGGFY